MKLVKKVCLIMLAALFSLSLAACGNHRDSRKKMPRSHSALISRKSGSHSYKTSVPQKDMTIKRNSGSRPSHKKLNKLQKKQKR